MLNPIAGDATASNSAPRSERGCARAQQRTRLSSQRAHSADISWRSERDALSRAEPRQYCQASSAVLHWSAADSAARERFGAAKAPARRYGTTGRVDSVMIGIFPFMFLLNSARSLSTNFLYAVFASVNAFSMSPSHASDASVGA